MHKSINGAYMVPKGQTRLGATLKEKKKTLALLGAYQRLNRLLHPIKDLMVPILPNGPKQTCKDQFPNFTSFSLHKTPKP